VNIFFNSKNEIAQHVVRNQTGLEFVFYRSHGALRRIGFKDIMANLYVGHPLEGSISNLYIRLIERDGLRYAPLIGPESKSVFSMTDTSVSWKGEVFGLSYVLLFTLSSDSDSWFYTVTATNTTQDEKHCDIVYIQDKGLTNEATVRINENYTSQYIDQKSFHVDHFGYVIASRQNHPFGDRCPWMIEGCLDGASGYLTDGVQFYGLSYKKDNIPMALEQRDWGNVVLQDEFSLTGLKSDIYILASGDTCTARYFGYIKENHTKATCEKDLSILDHVESWYEKSLTDQSAEVVDWRTPQTCFYNNISFFKTNALTDQELIDYFGSARSHVETAQGTLYSFFTDASHVVCQEKDLISPRTHGYIIRSGKELAGDLDVLSFSHFIYGGFIMRLSVGNTSFEEFMSHHRGMLNMLKSSGQRIFIKNQNGSYEMLGLPSTYEMGVTHARWIYKGSERTIEVKVWSDNDCSRAYMELAIVKGEKASFLVSHELALGGTEFDERGHILFDSEKGCVTVQPDENSFLGKRRPECTFFVAYEKDAVEVCGTDNLLGDGAAGQNLPYIVLKTQEIERLRVAIGGSARSQSQAQELCTHSDFADRSYESDISGAIHHWKNILRNIRISLPEGTGKDCRDVAKMSDILYWYLHNANVHFTIAFGLEQFKGGAWGTRDVLQGPIEALLPLKQYAPIREMILTVIKTQFIETGNWPQWFMLGAYKDIQHPESHGDIIVWPFKAITEYVEATNDFSILEEKIPYTVQDDPQKGYTEQKETVYEHLARAVEYIKTQCVPGTHLSIYDGGDWDDTLRPANKDLRERMVSGWTILITYQYLKAYSAILSKVGKLDESKELDDLVGKIKEDYCRYVIKDGVCAGFIYIGNAGEVDYIIHPSDERTNMHYRLLPMIRGIISEFFTPEEMVRYYTIIKEYLDCPDGARLMDKAVPYSGGPNRWFRRAEMCANFGREIGLMYAHAHIRYMEALAKMGKAEELFDSTMKIIPITITDNVQNAVTRQANAYFSSSDGDFKTRYEVDYASLREGTVPVKGGWRIYSSGPGLFINHIINNILGVKSSFGDLVIDPVIPSRFDALQYECDYAPEIKVLYIFRTAKKYSYGVSSVCINGKRVETVPLVNPYRMGGVRIPLNVVEECLEKGNNTVEIVLST